MENKQTQQQQEFILCDNNQLKEVVSVVKQLITEMQQQKTNSQPVLLREKQVQKLYGISRSFIRTLREEHNLSVIVVGGCNFYDSKVLADFFNKHVTTKNKI